MRILSSSCRAITALALIVRGASSRLLAATLLIVKGFEWQAFAAQVQRLIEAADFFGSPFSPDEQRAIATAMKETDSALASAAVQEVLDAHCLFGVNINPEMRVKVVQGTARPELVEQGWRLFLVKVQNEAGTTAELRALSPNAVSVYEGGSLQTASDRFYRKRGENRPAKSNAELWLDLETANHQPLKKELSGVALEYRMGQLYSGDAGQREGKVEFIVGQA